MKGLCQDQDIETRRFYDRLAEELADKWYDNAVLLPLIRRFVALLPSEPKVLDLGCGAGYESKRLALVGAEVVGVDYSSRSIAIARSRTPECRFEVMDFRQLDADLGWFDGVFASASLIHVPHEAIGDVFEQIANHLSPEGYVLVIVKDGEGTRETWLTVDGRRFRRVLYLYTLEDLDSAYPILVYQRDMTLSNELYDEGWRAYLFRRVTEADPAESGSDT